MPKAPVTAWPWALKGQGAMGKARARRRTDEQPMGDRLI